MAPANSFLTRGQTKKPERKFPLAIQFCPNCSLLSLAHVVNPNLLFANYYYLTSASAPLVEHFKDEAKLIASRYIKSKHDLVIEFGSNDGGLLLALKNKCRVLGVDPAKNVATIAKKNGVETKVAFFTEKTAKDIWMHYGKAKVVLANNVFAHIDDIHDVMRGVTKLLEPKGVFISESHWVGNLIGDGGFDQIYHEHLCYYSLHALSALAKQFGLVVTDAELVPIHGQSLRVFMSKTGTPNTRVKKILTREKKLGLHKIKTYRQFAKNTRQNKKVVQKLLSKLRKADKHIVGYGAPAKSNTLLNYFGIGPKILSYITDTTPNKQEHFTPGSHIPVVHPDTLKKNPPDYILLLSWNYANFILKKEKPLRKAGVKFIIPVPKVRVV